MKISTKINRKLLTIVSRLHMRGYYEHLLVIFYNLKEMLGLGTEVWKFDDFDFTFNIFSRERHSFNAFNEQDYCADSKEEMIKFIELSKNKTCLLDIGALYGVFSLSFCAMNSTNTAHAIEASPVAMKRLRLHKKINPTFNLQVYLQAIGIKKGELKMRWHDVFLEVIKKGETKYDVSVPMISIDEFIQEQNIKPDIIKIDIEGGEYDAIYGAQTYLLKHKPTLCFEVHTNFLRDQGHTPSEVFALLRRAGYSDIYTVDGQLVEGAPEDYFEGRDVYRLFTYAS